MAGGTSRLTDDRSFVTALKHIVKANVLAMIEILKRRPDAIFIQSESSEYFHADSPAAIHKAELMNSRRFLSLDLNYGRRVDSEMYEYLMDNGMTREEYHFFLNHRLKQHCILGNDYYMTNEHRVFADGHTESSGEVFGYSEITRQYYNRYRLPVMHTETNLREGPKGDEAVHWLWKEWANVLQDPQRRHPHRRLHLVFADRPGRLGHRAPRAERQRQPARPLRSRPQHPQRRPRLQEADLRLARRASGLEPVPVGADRPAVSSRTAPSPASSRRKRPSTSRASSPSPPIRRRRMTARHPGESRDPGYVCDLAAGRVPAFAGMTQL